jgi:ligand-binding sensor domain-containing protein/signal transduction histidine kinase
VLARALCWLILGVFGARLMAAPQTRYSVDVWGLDEGLPQSSIISMIQTRDGYLWLGTLNGLVRFDGVRFTVFDEGNTPGLESSRIVSLFEDGKGTLWIGTETAGAAIVKDGKVISLNIGQDRRQGRLMGICEDAAGAVWLYTADGDLVRVFNGTNTWNLGPSRYRGLIADNSGMVWAATDQGMMALNPAARLNPESLPSEQTVAVNALQYILASQNGGCWRLAEGMVQKWTGDQLDCDWGAYPWGNTPISTACEDSEGNLVVGTLGHGLYWFDADGKATCLTTNEGLSNNYILSLRPDRDGSLWVGTDGGGLNRVRAQVFRPLEDSLGANVLSVAEDNEGGVWFTSSRIRSSRICRWKDGALTQYGGVPVNLLNLRAVCVDHHQNVWVGTLGLGLLRLQDGMFRPFGPESLNKDISAICEDHAGRLWVGTEGGLACFDGSEWKIYTTADGLSANMIRAIAEGPNGSLWIGTERGGLNRLYNGRFLSLRQADGFPSDNISALLVDDDGVVWVGTQGSGLIRLQDGKWVVCSTENGMSGNGIHSLVEDGRGCLWIGSNRGVMRVPKKELNDFSLGMNDFIPCRSFTRRDGLPSTECSLGAQPAALKSRDGRLWFATIKGLATVDPAQFHFNTNPPPVFIESVLIDGRRQNAGGLRATPPTRITVPPGIEVLEIQYTSINLDGPDRGHYRYWMENYESHWRDAHNSRVALYPKLPPGSYIFHVSACNDDGQWNPAGTSLAVVVEPPFWRTAWFLTLVSVLMLGAIIGCVYYISTQRLQRQLTDLRHHEVLEKERARISRDIHDQVGASLTQVALLGEMVECDKDLPEEVEQHAKQITQTARETSRALDEIVWTVNPSNDTLEGLVNYICKHAQEYLAVAGLRYRLEVPPLPNAGITPEARHNVFLAAKEAVTNVVKHAKASEVWIRLTLEDAAFILEIEDNGKGHAGLEDKAKQTRNGLRNMRKRMEDIGGEFSIGPRPEGGSRVRLKAPFNKT